MCSSDLQHILDIEDLWPLIIDYADPHLDWDTFSALNKVNKSLYSKTYAILQHLNQKHVLKQNMMHTLDLISHTYDPHCLDILRRPEFILIPLFLFAGQEVGLYELPFSVHYITASLSAFILYCHFSHSRR